MFFGMLSRAAVSIGWVMFLAMLTRQSGSSSIAGPVKDAIDALARTVQLGARLTL